MCLRPYIDCERIHHPAHRSDQDLHYPQTEIMDPTEFMNGAKAGMILRAHFCARSKAPFPLSWPNYYSEQHSNTYCDLG